MLYRSVSSSIACSTPVDVGMHETMGLRSGSGAPVFADSPSIGMVQPTLWGLAVYPALSCMATIVVFCSMRSFKWVIRVVVSMSSLPSVGF